MLFSFRTREGPLQVSLFYSFPIFAEKKRKSLFLFLLLRITAFSSYCPLDTGYEEDTQGRATKGNNALFFSFNNYKIQQRDKARVP